MKALQLFSPSPIEKNPLILTEIPEPQPSDNEILIKVNMCGVCHTDLHTVEGEIRPKSLPIIPGHQVVGTVYKMGKLAKRYKIGDKVGVGWLYSACGSCEYCKTGKENLCSQAKFTGFDENGGYAEFMKISEDFAYLIPEGFDDIKAAPLLCAGIIGYRSLKLSGIRPGEKLGLYGFGASAHIAIQVARFWKCKVYVFTRSSEHQYHAKSLGAAWVGTANETPPEKLDASITFAPAGWIVPLALSHLKKGGTLAINAIYMSPIPEFPYNNIYGERILRSVANFTRKDAKEFLEIAAKIPIETTTTLYPIEEANKVLKLLKDSKINGAAVFKI